MTTRVSSSCGLERPTITYVKPSGAIRTPPTCQPGNVSTWIDARRYVVVPYVASRAVPPSICATRNRPAAEPASRYGSMPDQLPYEY